jgi:hypothetical protein
MKLELIHDKKMITLKEGNHELTIYHGSIIPVEIPKILKSERMLDFGDGFYTTSNREQADDQILFHTEKSLNYCRYIRHIEIGGELSGTE